MQLYNKKLTLSEFFAPFLKCEANFEDFERKGFVRKLSKRPCFRARLDSQHAKGSHTPLKSA